MGTDRKEGSPGRGRAPRNPDGRRKAILDAAVRIVEQDGAASLSHRRIAVEAGVPLGSIAQYFDSIANVRACALEELSDRMKEELDAQISVIDLTNIDPESIADWFVGMLENDEVTRADARRLAACVDDDDMQPLAQRALDSFASCFSPFMEGWQARALAALYDGFVMESRACGALPDPECIRRTVRAILAA